MSVRRYKGPTADEWNARHPVGTPVHYWPGTRKAGDEPRTSKTSTAAYLPASGTPMVMVEDYRGGIALTHVEAVEACAVDRYAPDGRAQAGHAHMGLMMLLGLLACICALALSSEGTLRQNAVDRTQHDGQAAMILDDCSPLSHPPNHTHGHHGHSKGDRRIIIDDFDPLGRRR